MSQLAKTLAKAAAALAATASLTACASALPERGPAPPPPLGYRVVCTTTPLPFYVFASGCTAVEVPAATERRTVVRAKG